MWRKGRRRRPYRYNIFNIRRNRKKIEKTGTSCTSGSSLCRVRMAWRDIEDMYFDAALGRVGGMSFFVGKYKRGHLVAEEGAGGMRGKYV